MTNPVAKIELEGTTHEFPIIEGSEHEKAIAIGKLRGQTGYITLDDGYGNTGSCQSEITFIDGEKGILRYRGYPIDELAEKSTFLETVHLLIYGELPTQSELNELSSLVGDTAVLDEKMIHHFEGFPRNAHPMAILSSMINASSCFYPELLEPYHPDTFKAHAARLISQVRTIAAYSYRASTGQPFNYPNPDFSYTHNFLHMLFSKPWKEFTPAPEITEALDLIFLLHADHEQNCSTSTVRMVASSRANVFASTAAGVCALWGPLHGGANQAVIEMLRSIREEGDDGTKFIEAAKDKTSGKRLMGFGHRVYKNYDPRAKIIQKKCGALLQSLDLKDPLLDIAKRLEETALNDPYFVDRKLYPNVDFYSGIIMRALGIPLNMFTVIFAIGRMPGWIANYKEIMDHPETRIYRPRQVYMGKEERSFTPIEKR